VYLISPQCIFEKSREAHSYHCKDNADSAKDSFGRRDAREIFREIQTPHNSVQRGEDIVSTLLSFGLWIREFRVRVRAKGHCSGKTVRKVPPPSGLLCIEMSGNRWCALHLQAMLSKFGSSRTAFSQIPKTRQARTEHEPNTGDLRSHPRKRLPLDAMRLDESESLRVSSHPLMYRSGVSSESKDPGMSMRECSTRTIERNRRHTTLYPKPR